MVRLDPFSSTKLRHATAVLLGALALVVGTTSTAWPQAPLGPPAAPQVADVRIVGNRVARLRDLAGKVQTRAGRPFEAELVEEDVRRLIATRKFLNVETQYQNVPGGVVVIFQVVERPTVGEVKYVGNRKVRATNLERESGLKAGDALDPYSIEEARRKIEDFYRARGFSKARVTLFEGDKATDSRVIFLINEGQKQRIWKTQFVGNDPSVVTAARLKTLIQSKPGFFWLIKGEVDREKIDADVERIKAYYRSLGFFRARVGRDAEFDEDQNWLTLTFVIDEGPRYAIRNVAIVGAQRFDAAALETDLKLNAGTFFDQQAMTADAASIQDKYGAKGYIKAAVNPNLRFLEEPGVLDLVYEIEEGARYRVGRVEVRIKGDHPQTRESTVLNRISLRPGDIVDNRQLKDSERRLRASGLFLNDPIRGATPTIVFRDPDPSEAFVAEEPPPVGNFRGQSPANERPSGLRLFNAAPASGDRIVNLVIDGEWSAEANHRAGQADTPAQPASPAEQIPDGSAPVVRGQSPGWRPWSVESNARGQSPASNGIPRDWQSSAAATHGAGAADGRHADDHGSRRAEVGPTPGAASPSDGRYVTPVQYAAPYAPPPQYVPPPSQAPPYNAAPPVQNVVPPTAAPGQFGPPSTIAGPPGGVLYPPGGYGFLDDGETTRPIDIIAEVEETTTGRFMFGVGVNSDAGVVGSVVMHEQNFDFTRFPRGWDDIRNATAFRGAGQTLRIEAVPGTELNRYMINFREPYLFNSLVSFGVSGFFFDRRFRDWDEERLGGRLSLGYQFPYRPDLSVTGSIRAENVEISNPRIPTPPDLTAVLGDNELYSGRLAITHDTRDNAFLPTEGHLLELGFEQVFGDYNFPRATIEARQFFLMHQRIDGSGRHVLSVAGQAGFSGDDTPLFERFFAGGFSTLRGFDFRGASPRVLNVAVGGEFQLLGSVEYMLPLTADDMLRGVVFCDFGTVEESIEIDADDFRVAPGIGLRITVPALGPAPIALDLAVPVAHAGGDDIRNFSFFVGFGR